MNIQQETNKILGQRLLDEFDSKKMVEWAVSAMKLGHDSESLVILAGLDYDTTEEREEYFWKALGELTLNIEREEFQLINDYAIYVAKAVIENMLSPESGLKKMFDICRKTEYDSKYIQFYELDEDMDYLKYGDHRPIFNHGITLENANDYIKKEFEIFLECESLEIDNETREKAFCNNCEQIRTPKLKTRYQFKRPFRYQEWVCEYCSSSKIDLFGSRIGKEKILKEIKNHTQQRNELKV